MKKPLFFFVSILMYLSIFGQKSKDKDSNIPAFGKVEKTDLEMMECDFDKNAEAMVLFEKGQLDCILGKGFELERHIRIKILNDKGKDRADIHLSYHNWQNDEDIKDITAQVYNLDDERISDVFFGMLQSHTLIGTIFIPEGYQFDELPKNIRMIMPDTSVVVSRAAQLVDNMLSFRINLEFKKPFYTADEYPGFREFYKKLFDLLNEQFVIKKKAKP